MLRKILFEQSVAASLISRLKDRGINFAPLPTGDMLGSGFEGKIYKVPDSNKVFKVEVIDDELAKRKRKAGEKIEGDKFEYVCRLFAIREYEGDYKSAVATVWEYLEPIDDSLRNELKQHYRSWTKKMKFLPKYDPELKADIYNEWRHEESVDEISPEVEKILLDVYMGFGELNDRNVFPYDTHEGNIMQDPKTKNYKLIDFL